MEWCQGESLEWPNPMSDLTDALIEIARAGMGQPDPRDPDPSRPGIFRDHNCWACKDGAQPCREGNSSQCPYPHARND